MRQGSRCPTESRKAERTVVAVKAGTKERESQGSSLCAWKDLVPLQHIMSAGRGVVAALGQGEGFFEVYFHCEFPDPV